MRWRLHFDLSALREYTVEAGRPDTVTADKLRTIKDAGATRISINPQTLREDVLQAIGGGTPSPSFMRPLICAPLRT